jgi:hypothetical protein
MSNNDENDSVANGANRKRNQEVESESTQMKRKIRRLKKQLENIKKGVLREMELNPAQLDALSDQYTRFFAYRKYYGPVEYKTDAGSATLEKALRKIGVNDPAEILSLKKDTTSKIGEYLTQKRNRIVKAVMLQLESKLMCYVWCGLVLN